MLGCTADLEQIGLRLNPKPSKISNIEDAFLNWQLTLGLDQEVFKAVCILAWYLWMRRNEVVFSQKNLPDET